MRCTPMYFKYPRSPQNVDKVPLRELSPLSLQDKVSGSPSNTLENKCLYEMSLLFKCWTDNEFNDELCTQQKEALNLCYQNYTAFAAEQRKLRKIDIPSPNAKAFTNKQISYLLRMYPTV